MTEVAWRILGLALSALILLTTGFGLGMWQSTNHLRPQLDESAALLVMCKWAWGNLEELTKEQNAKLGQLANQAEQWQAKATQAVANAQQQAGQHYAAAQRLQHERADGDQCAASEAVIDKELGL
ncbi:hypothetical protein ACQCLI_18760 [Pseudomonas nitroreducens]|uniref:hypothetical protein n=1 Tax=Pseudomonas TaxID=286 RepID=UPI0003660E66|nr:hypothetical protein [Pseudomonas nitroreducens]